MRKIVTFALVIMLMMPALSAQKVSPAVALKDYSFSVFEHMKFLGMDNGDIIVSLRQAPAKSGKTSMRPMIFRLGQDMTVKGRCDLGKIDMLLRYATIVNGKLHVMLSEQTGNQINLYAYTVDLATMKQVGDPKPLLELKFKQLDDIFVFFNASPSDEFILINSVAGTNKTNELSHQLAMFDNEFNLQWKKSVPFLFNAITANDLGEAVLVTANKKTIDVHVINDENDKVISSPNTVGAYSVSIVDITPTGKMIIGGVTGVRNIHSGVYGGAVDLTKDEFIQLSSHKFTEAELRELNNAENDKKSYNKNLIKGNRLSVEQRKRTDFGGLLVFSNEYVESMINRKDTSVYYEGLHNGANLLAIDTMGSIVWNHALCVPMLDQALCIVAIPHGDDVTVAFTQSNKASTETIPSAPQTQLLKGKTAKSVLTTFHPDGSYSRKAFCEKDNTMVREPVIKLDDNNYRIFLSKSPDSKYFDITF